MADKCPYCFRNIGSWQHDPILLPNGSKYDWISETELVYEPDIDNRWYKGVDLIKESDVQSLQDVLKQLEIDLILEVNRTNFSPLNANGIFQVTGSHIKEMRDSVEKLLNTIGMVKIDYFNQDEDGHHIIHPLGDKSDWTDPITQSTDLQKFQVKNIHIEDLRRFLREVWIEKFDVLAPIVWQDDGSGEHNMQLSPITFTGDKGIYSIHAPSSPANYNVAIGVDIRTGALAIFESALNEAIDDGSGNSSKLHTHLTGMLNQTGHIPEHPYIQNPGTILFSQTFSGHISNPIPWLIPKVLLTASTLAVLDLHLVVNNDFDHGWFIFYYQINFNTGNSLTYYYAEGSYPYSISGGIPLTLPEFNNFNRNLYNDYVSLWGIPLAETKLNTFEFYVNAAMNTSFDFPIASGDVEFTIDNIKYT